MTKKNVSANKITMIEPVDMSKPMYGNGIATVVASAIRVIGDRLILVGLTSNEELHPVGKWCKTTLFGKTCHFFPVMSVNELDAKYIKNLSFTIRLIRYWHKIKKDNSIVITQNYMVMWLLSFTHYFLYKVFYFPGLANPMLVGRKPVLGRILYKLYETILLSRLRSIEIIFAAASCAEIENTKKNWNRKLKGKTIYQLPTSVDIDLFSPQPAVSKLMKKYSLQDGGLYFVSVGRLAKVKGIDFLIDALVIYQQQYQPAKLLLVGEGEEREYLEQYVKSKGLMDSVIFFGNRMPVEVRDIINCVDVCLVGSTFEGFSCAMVEQIACGKPLVSTNVSGASEIIDEQKNGFIVKDRDPGKFAAAIHKTLGLEGAGKYSRELAVSRYSEHVIWNSFLKQVEKDFDKVNSMA